ncbi:nitrate- and nitrite sensing domain-containing protein [Streptomyces griseoluteus]|uniref:sensor histidine kinase n=1 Tax=Streptomyces griseoluteus TaxID=29306 RepID=UPI003330AB0E
MRPPRSTPKAGPPAQSPTPLRGRRAHAGPPADEGPDAYLDMAPDYAPPRPGRWHMRPRTVRAKVVCLLMVPVVSLLALWAYATVTTAQEVSRLRQSQRVDAELRTPVAVAVGALQAERAAAVRYAAEPNTARGNDLRGLAATTDRAVAKLRLGDASTVAAGQQLPAGVGSRMQTFVGDAGQLRSLRTAVLGREADWAAAYDRYSKTIDAAFAVDGALSGIQRADVGSDARVLLEFSRAAEALSQENAILGSTGPDDTLRGRRALLLDGAVANRRALTQVAVADLPAAQRAAWNRLARGRAHLALTATEDRFLAAGPGAKAVDTEPGSAWAGAHARVQADMATIAADTSRTVAGRADPFTHGVLSVAGAAVLFGLAAVVASLVISVRIGRALVVELVSLRNDALEIARRKLPAAMRKLRAGAEIDIRAEAPAGPPAEDETGQVAEALTTVHRAALHAAVERAELASGISGVFVNLARRSQVLVHRQLSLLDSMERRSDDPDELSDLFRLDHLTTRMRRHAESLIILSGAAPGRAWRMPVSLTNVVRAAVSEIEDYARVEVRQLPEAAVIGAAVADLTHLLAELVENAAQFSPPHTRVRVSGEPVGNGYVLEVEDRGLGMSGETLVEANRRIEQSETLDLFDSDRLGLFVVSRLAARQGIKVHLRTSPYGGTTAVVLLPTALVHQGTPEEPAEAPRAPQEPEREYARVPEASAPAAVTTQTERPALVATVPPPAEPVPDTPPPGVSTLRPHRPPTDSESSDDLPRRVRQASLAPQLRKERPAEPAAESEPPDDEGRTPEVVRDRMAAYRDGWVRGGGRRPGRVAPSPAPGGESTEGEPA